MNVTFLGIPDINIDNIDSEKVRFANTIISKIKPLFSNVIDSLNKKISETKNKLTEIEKESNIAQKKLEALTSQFKRDKKIKILLDTINSNSKLTRDGISRNEVVVLMRILDKLSIEKIDESIKKFS